MSIYGGQRGRKNASDIHDGIASRAPGATPSPLDAGTGQWLEHRKAAPANYLLPSTRKWAEALPQDVQPLALALHFPRVLNLIAAQWNDHHACPALFEDLLGDRRGGRAGFPVDALRDVANLQEYWYNGHALR